MLLDLFNEVFIVVKECSSYCFLVPSFSHHARQVLLIAYLSRPQINKLFGFIIFH